VFNSGANGIVKMVAARAAVHRAVAGESVDVAAFGALIDTFLFTSGAVQGPEIVEQRQQRREKKRNAGEQG
jgi:hypothetical protein